MTNNFNSIAKNNKKKKNVIMGEKIPAGVSFLRQHVRTKQFESTVRSYLRSAATRKVSKLFFFFLSPFFTGSFNFSRHFLLCDKNLRHKVLFFLSFIERKGLNQKTRSYSIVDGQCCYGI